MTTLTLTIIFLVLMIPGIIGVFVPLIPSVPYLFVVALVFGLVDHFEHLSENELLILFILALFSLAVDYFAGILGAKYGGANHKSIFAGIVGLALGLLIFPPLGSILGLFIGVFIGERYQDRTHKKALRAATGSLIGTVTGIIVNIIIAVIFIISFVLFI